MNDNTVMNYPTYKLKDQYSSDITMVIRFFFTGLVMLLVGLIIIIIIMVSSMMISGGIFSIEYIPAVYASSSSSSSTATNTQVTSSVQILPAIADDAPIITSLIADDPDDLDNVYSINDHNNNI